MTALLIIDPQNDFYTGSLAIPTATTDAYTLSEAFRRHLADIDTVVVSLDKHQLVDISHPIWWVDSDGKNPPPFTQITLADMAAGRWRSSKPARQDHSRWYLQQLEERSGLTHTIWPPHCLWGTWGANIEPYTAGVLTEWQEFHERTVQYVEKGMNRYTEHFSAVRACVTTGDPATRTNRQFVSSLEYRDAVLVAGQASSHCVAATVIDLINEYSDRNNARNIHLLTDAMSPVPGFEHLEEAFFGFAAGVGVRLTTCAEAFAQLRND